MNIVFLDIDGVLNRGGSHGEEGALNPAMVSVFLKMLGRCKAEVVLSSSWKNNAYSRGIIWVHVCPFIDVTPTFHVEGKDHTQLRGAEIDEWLKAHPGVNRYAIIDDTGEILDSQMPNFFKTRSDIGLTQEIADAVIKHFND